MEYKIYYKEEFYVNTNLTPYSNQVMNWCELAWFIGSTGYVLKNSFLLQMGFELRTLKITSTHSNHLTMYAVVL